MIQERKTSFKVKEAVSINCGVNKLDLNNLAGKYKVYVIFHGAFNIVSSLEVQAFRSALSSFEKEGATIVGVVRESIYAIQVILFICARSVIRIY